MGRVGLETNAYLYYKIRWTYSKQHLELILGEIDVFGYKFKIFKHVHRLDHGLWKKSRILRNFVLGMAKDKKGIHEWK